MDWKQLSKATQALRQTVLQRREFLGGDDREDSVEERGLLRDVEQCIKSAEEIMRVMTMGVNGSEASQNSPPHLPETQTDPRPNGSLPWVTQIAVRNGSSIATTQPDSKTEDQPSDDSGVESILDPEPELGVGFTPEVYSSIITNLLEELQRHRDAREYRQAVRTYRTIVKHHVDREINLGIPFDNRSELSEKLIEVYLSQERYQKAKKCLSQLLQEDLLDADRKWRLYLYLATAYLGQKRSDKALRFAQRSLNGRQELYGQTHDLTHQAALQVIGIYEQQREEATANALRSIYFPSTVPPPPPKSALRATSQRRTSSPPQNSPAHIAPQSRSSQSYQEEAVQHNTNHVRWAPDVWANDSGMNAIVASGRTMLIDAIHTRDEEYVKLMLNRGADVETPCVDTITPLMHAIIQQFPDIVKLLLDHGAQVDGTVSGWTPLHKATALGNFAIMRLLLAKDADIEFKSSLDFVSPAQASLETNASRGYDPETDGTSDSDQGWTPLLRAAIQGDPAAVGLLLDHHADIEAQNPTKKTALMCACEHLHFKTVDQLLMRGANVHAHDDFGWRPLHYALVNRSTEPLNPIIPHLLDHEADVNTRCKFLKTPLQLAIEKNDGSAVKFLLSKDADIEARDIAERTPLHTAIECRLESMVRLLIEQGADATAMDKFGRDALAAANHADRKSPEIIALLQKQKKRLKRENSAAAQGHGVKKPSFGERKRGNLGGPAASGINHAASDSSKKSGKGGWFGSRSGKN